MGRAEAGAGADAGAAEEREEEQGRAEEDEEEESGPPDAAAAAAPAPPPARDSAPAAWLISAGGDVQADSLGGLDDAYACATCGIERLAT